MREMLIVVDDTCRGGIDVHCAWTVEKESTRSKAEIRTWALSPPGIN